jgi:hypothetical protein
MKYSGIPVAVGTSMGLSSIGDAYINFGVTGGCFFMFFYGLLFNLFLKFFNRYSNKFPILMLFTCVVFYYPIRPDCEMQTILGHLFKATVIIFFVINFWKDRFSLRNDNKFHLTT